MEICHLSRPWSFLSHTSLDSWPLEYTLRAFIRHPSIDTFSPKHTSQRPHFELQPTLTTFHTKGPPLRLVATACSLALIGSLISLAVFLLLWTSKIPPTKAPVGAALSETTVLRIHDMASRQPYLMPPPDGGDDGTFTFLPFADNSRKQSLFMFWLVFLVVAGVAAYYFRPVWLPAVLRHIAEQNNRLSWTGTIFLSVVLAKLTARFLAFAFFLVPVIKSTILWIKWMAITIFVKPATTAHSAHLEVARIAHCISHWYLGIPLNRPLPERVDRSITQVSSVVSVVAGYRLISSRVARNYALIIKSMIQRPLEVGHIYLSLRHADFLTNRFQTWGWWATKHILRFSLGELSLRSISWLKLSALTAPSLVICAYAIYKYNQVIVPPRTVLQVALDPIHRELYEQRIGAHKRDVKLAEITRKQDVVLAEITLLLQTLGQRAVNADLGSAQDAPP
ncbi:hypothetical protein C8R44DRAFT_983814 [Mycena epipterygia]|nr:hypothetical protein C8R44DRAFT_983814 [Mycena epipterygia]